MRDAVQCLVALGLAALVSMTSGCATRPTNPTLDRIDDELVVKLAGGDPCTGLIDPTGFYR